MQEAYFTWRLLDALTRADEAGDDEERSVHLRTSSYYRELLNASDCRHSPRREVKIAALLHDLSDVPLPVIVCDLSTAGFRARVKQSVVPGTRVVLRIDGHAPIEAQAAWPSEGEAGFQFRPSSTPFCSTPRSR